MQATRQEANQQEAPTEQQSFRSIEDIQQAGINVSTQIGCVSPNQN